MPRVKHVVAWILTGVWAALLLWTSWNYIQNFLTNPGPATMKEVFASIGALLVGVAPLYAAWQWHRFSQKRMRKTLTKQREKIDRKLERLGPEARQQPEPRPGAGAAGPMAESAPPEAARRATH